MFSMPFSSSSNLWKIKTYQLSEEIYLYWKYNIKFDRNKKQKSIGNCLFGVQKCTFKFRRPHVSGQLDSTHGQSVNSLKTQQILNNKSKDFVNKWKSVRSLTSSSSRGSSCMGKDEHDLLWLAITTAVYNK